MTTRGKEKQQRPHGATYNELRKKVVNKLDENSRRILGTISPKARLLLDSAASHPQPPPVETRKDSKSVTSTEREKNKPSQPAQPRRPKAEQGRNCSQAQKGKSAERFNKSKIHAIPTTKAPVTSPGPGPSPSSLQPKTDLSERLAKYTAKEHISIKNPAAKRKIEKLLKTPLSRTDKVPFGSGKKNGTMARAMKTGGSATGNSSRRPEVTAKAGSDNKATKPKVAVPKMNITKGMKGKYEPLKKSVTNAISSFVQTRNEAGRGKISTTQLYSSTINNPLRANNATVAPNNNIVSNSQKGSFARPAANEGEAGPGNEGEKPKGPAGEDEGVKYVITSGDHIDEQDEQIYNIKERLKYYEEKVEQIEGERQEKEHENQELRMCINKLTSELTDKESKIKYFSKLQIDDPSTPMNVVDEPTPKAGCVIM